MSDRYAFGDFVLEPLQQRLLRHDGTALNLSPRLFSALLMFVQQQGQLLDKDTLMKALWPGLVVEENNLSQVVAALRRLLGDDAQGSRFIATVPRRGFRFVADVRALPEPAALRPSAPIAPGAPAAAAGSDTGAPGATSAAEPASAAAPRPSVADTGRRRGLRLALGTAAVAAALGGGWWAAQRRPAMARGANTLAVLPFKPLSGEGRDELLELGMADSLAARLSTVPGLVVRSTGSVLRFAGLAQDPLQAARELDATWIVDGTLQRRGDDLRVTARLLNAADGTAAWSGSFDDKFAGVFDVQDRISERVMGALAPLLNATATVASGEPGGTRSVEAYQLYLTARWRAQGGRVEDIDRGIKLLERALAIDPAFAVAWTEMAWIHRRRLWNADTEPIDVFKPANQALQRALALAPGLAAAHAGTGFSRYWYDYDWPGADREFRLALAKDPNTVSAHHGLSMKLLTQGRPEEGFMHLRLARELEPMSPLFNTMEASYLIDAGRLGEARTRLDRAFDLNPRLWLAHVALGLLLLAERQSEQGIAALRQAAELGRDTTRPTAVLAVHLARLGRADEARSLLGGLLERSKSRFVAPTSIAAVQAALGEKAAALDALDRAYQVRDTRLIFLKDDPNWAGLRGEPRFAALKTRLGLDGLGRGLTPV